MYKKTLSLILISSFSFNILAEASFSKDAWHAVSGVVGALCIASSSDERKNAPALKIFSLNKIYESSEYFLDNRLVGAVPKKHESIRIRIDDFRAGCSVVASLYALQDIVRNPTEGPAPIKVHGMENYQGKGKNALLNVMVAAWAAKELRFSGSRLYEKFLMDDKGGSGVEGDY